MRTLADMTPQERAQCRGMWAKTLDGLAIIIDWFYIDGALYSTVAFSLKPDAKISKHIADSVIPLPDLPRARARKYATG